MRTKTRSGFRWFESQLGDASDGGIIYSLAIGTAMWAVLAFIVWLSHRLA